MATDFSRTLSLLRQEKGISQRKAAAALGISQALLSHYENGIREPGLAFVCKVCDFYRVSADFLLGRTANRDGAMIDSETLYDGSTEKGSLRGSIMATLQKKLAVNTTGLLFDLLSRTNSREAIHRPPETASAPRCTICCGGCTGKAAAMRICSPQRRWTSMPAQWTRRCCGAAEPICGH